MVNKEFFIGLDLGQFVEGHPLLKNQRQKVVGDAHKAQSGSAHHRHMEVTGDADGVVDHNVDLLGADDHTGDAAAEAEDHQRNPQGREARIAPRRLG